MGSSPLQGLENCLREIPVPRPQSASSWSSAGDRGPQRAEPKNWTADKEGKAWPARCLRAGQGDSHTANPRPVSLRGRQAHFQPRDEMLWGWLWQGLL